MANWNIEQIEAITQREASAMALKTMTIKDHVVYFVDFDGYFMYSALVFMDGMHIRFADEYELHYTHMNYSRQQLHDKYVEKLNAKLFTEAELTGPIATYDEYKCKSYFLHNYYGMRRRNVTIFAVNPSDAERQAFKARTAAMTYDPVAFAYYDDPAFVEHHIALNNALESVWERRQNDYDVMKSAFMYEMWNHEYAINWQGNYDVFSVFGNVRYHDPDWEIEHYFEQLHFTDLQRRAFMDARREYMRQANESC